MFKGRLHLGPTPSSQCLPQSHPWRGNSNSTWEGSEDDRKGETYRPQRSTTHTHVRLHIDTHTHLTHTPRLAALTLVDTREATDKVEEPRVRHAESEQVSGLTANAIAVIFPWWRTFLSRRLNWSDEFVQALTWFFWVSCITFLFTNSEKKSQSKNNVFFSIRCSKIDSAWVISLRKNMLRWKQIIFIYSL